MPSTPSLSPCTAAGIPPLPETFKIPDLLPLLAPILDLRTNRHYEPASKNARRWFRDAGLLTEPKLSKFLNYNIDFLTAQTYPDADQEQLEACMKWHYLIVAFDDLSDQGGPDNSLDALTEAANLTIDALERPEIPVTRFKYAELFRSTFFDMISRQKRARSDPTYDPPFRARLVTRFEEYVHGMLKTHLNRDESVVPTVEEFIVIRRDAGAFPQLFALVEYALDLGLPDEVVTHPIMVELQKTVNDLLVLPNDILSFNTEQSHGDTQNLLFSIMVHQNLGLQDAIYYAVEEIIKPRVEKYHQLRRSLPSFVELGASQAGGSPSTNIDRAVQRYLGGLEAWIGGAVMWYYASSRFFRDQLGADRTNLVVRLFPKAEEKFMPVEVAS